MAENKTAQQKLNCEKLFEKFAQDYKGTDFDEIIEVFEKNPELLEEYCDRFKWLFQNAEEIDYTELRKEFIDTVSEIIEDKFGFDSFEIYDILRDKDLYEIAELATQIIKDEINEIDLVKKLYAMENGLEYWEDIDVYSNWDDLIENVLDFCECPEKCRDYIDYDKLIRDLEIDGYNEFLGYIVRGY